MLHREMLARNSFLLKAIPHARQLNTNPRHDFTHVSRFAKELHAIASIKLDQHFTHESGSLAIHPIERDEISLV